MDSDGHLGSCLDLGDGTSRQLVLGVLTDVDVTTQLGSPTLVDEIGGDLGITNDGGILLARADGSAISCQSSVD